MTVAILRADEIRELNYEEMEEKLKELHQELFSERSKKAAGGAPENPGRIHEIKRTIARIHTIMTETSMEGS